MVGAALHRDDHVVVVVPERAGAGQHPDVRARRQRFAGAGREFVRRAAPHRRRAGEEASPEDGPVLDEDDPRPGAGRRLRRHQAGRAGADDEHVAEGVAAVVTVGVGLDRRPAQTRRLADEVLVEPPPRAGPHERLVVEAGREQPR